MYRISRPAFDLACDRECPHRGQPRSDCNNPRGRCLTICASQPMTLLVPQINGAMFLDRHDELWYVPGLLPGHWDWRNATPISSGHPLSEIGDRTASLLHETHEGVLCLVHRL
ncbi:hypothetical protein ACIA5D_27360 [Actinoplanes sp. NPDC051513]|uniref:hypothetical protein n=1 Tax=Actinoplanes sp. NPDC051513 TaxID=3363908 RepID=UPI0037A67297